MFDVPIALVSLVDVDRQWFKSKQGIDASETPRSISFCSHAIVEDHIMEIPDAREDIRFFDNPVSRAIRTCASMQVVPSRSAAAMPSAHCAWSTASLVR